MELTDTQKRILEVGKREFLEKGFKDASLRAIVKEAGFTKGAFYGYYNSKEALFDALVAPAADELIAQFKQAQQAHYELVTEDKAEQSQDLSTSYLNYFINYIYDHFDSFKLVICCSEGTRYANFPHDWVELLMKATSAYLAEAQRRGLCRNDVEPAELHILLSAFWTTIYEPFIHHFTWEQIEAHCRIVCGLFNWHGALHFQK